MIDQQVRTNEGQADAQNLLLGHAKPVRNLRSELSDFAAVL
jgi:hypothetical protein